MAHDKAYREAEKKIEEARRSGAEFLDLTSKWVADKLTQTEDGRGWVAQVPHRLSGLKVAGR